MSAVVRPDDSSAKTSHRAGSPNHQNTSKENTMIQAQRWGTQIVRVLG